MKRWMNTGKSVAGCMILSLLVILGIWTYNNMSNFDYGGFSMLDLRSGYSTPCRSTSSSPLNVYMYELPRRFHVGMMSQSNRKLSDDNLAVTADNLPVWPDRSGLKRQHSVEYWMMASLLNKGDGGNETTQEVVRVLDPESADVFFVPFFSSLSFNTHGRNMTDPETEKDRQLQVSDLIECLKI